jgi:hypothetical protein
MNPQRPEAAFQQQVLDLARIYGWRAYHTHDSRRSEPGFPDLVLIRAPELIFAELKTSSGRLSPAQHEWIAMLSLVEEGIAQRAGDPPESRLVEVNIWRPSDFDAIHGRLARRRPTIRRAA